MLRIALGSFRGSTGDCSFETLVELGHTTGTTGTVWHFFCAEELRRLEETCELTRPEMAGCEGLSTGWAEATNRLGENEARWERWRRLILETAAEPAVVDMAEHILYVSRV